MYASVDRAATGYLVHSDDALVWMDAGGGTWANLLRCCDYRSLTGILLSHRHPDHVIDVFQAFHARQYGDPKPLEAITLWAPEETLERLEGFSRDILTAFNAVPISDESVLEIGATRFTFARMAHPVVTLGVRVETPSGTLAYSADTGPGGDFRRLAADADVFVCEATFQDSDAEWEGHMRASQAAAVATEIGARSLVLSHLPHERDLDISLKEARAVSDIDVSLAEDLRRIEVRA
jgi:ribonuclease BN (tRNA processing enzyme)